MVLSAVSAKLYETLQLSPVFQNSVNEARRRLRSATGASETRPSGAVPAHMQARLRGRGERIQLSSVISSPRYDATSSV